MKSLRLLLNHHPHITYVSLAGILSIFSLGPTPGMIPIVLNLSTLLVYSRQIFPTFAQHTIRNTSALWVALTMGGSIPRFQASIHALSQPSISIASLFLLSGITSFLSIGALFIENRLGRRLNPFESSRLFFFPAIWATFWATIASLSPFGTLSTWSPVEGTGAYDWLVPWLGPESLNWVVAAWAVIVSEAVTSLYMMGSTTEDEYDPPSAADLIETEPTSNGHYHHSIGNGIPGVRSIFAEKNKAALLAAVLILLTVPSYIANPLPLSLGDVSKVTPLAVGCALPTFDEHKVHEFGLEHYLFESQRLDPSANFILWPEGAVRFRSVVERNAALAEVRKTIHHAFVGVAFEETLDDPEDSRNRNGIRRTGIAIVSNRSTTPHLVYYKRHLVPIAESFSLTHSREPPSAFTAEVSYSKRSYHRYPVDGHKREVNVTASICLDFSAPSQFENLDMKPGLILAPARTWDVTVGYTMWKQASQRAHEIGSTILWCDGGAGGVSGVAGQGLNEVVQRGPGSWVRNIGLEYPFHDQRTFFARYGNSAIILFWALVAGSPLARKSGGYARATLRWFRGRTTSSGPPVGHLLDA